jgi:AraC-like DNA-binding protein
MDLSLNCGINPPQPLPPGLPTRQFRSYDIDETREHIGRMFCDHDMRLVDRRARIDTHTCRLDCGSVSIVEMSYGAKVMVQPGSLDDFYLVQIPLAGRARDIIGGKEYDCRPGMATVQNPDEPLEMLWDEACNKLVLRFDRSRFERFAELQLGDVPRGGLRLAPSFALDRFEGAVFASLLGGLQTAGREGWPAIPARMLGHWELCFMSALILLRQDEVPAEQTGQTGAVRRVRDFLEANAAQPIALDDLRAVAGVPLRTLHHQFRRTLGLTPLQMLRDIRLDRVRGELLRGRDGTSVTTVALEWGFDHLGRFAATYRQRFGETPRETLLRARRH